MTTIINTPPSGESSNSGLGLVLGVILVLILGALFFIYGLPAIRNNNTVPQNGNIDVNISVPANVTTPSPAVNP